MFPYTPNDVPPAVDLPERIEAVLRGSAVAVVQARLAAFLAEKSAPRALPLRHAPPLPHGNGAVAGSTPGQLAHLSPVYILDRIQRSFRPEQPY